MRDARSQRAQRALRRKAGVCFVLFLLLMALLAAYAILYRNPWIKKTVSAEEVTYEELLETEKSSSPYVTLTGLDMTFTGYYKVSTKGEVRSYCYIASIKDKYILIDKKAEDGGNLAQAGSIYENADESELPSGAVLHDVTVSGQLSLSGELTGRLSEAESMSVDEYNSYYDMSGLELHEYREDSEIHRIIQGMMAIVAVGFLICSIIMLSESRMVAAKRRLADMDRRDRKKDGRNEQDFDDI